ncbi:DM13 domain-containing protein [Prosthecomicrobium hirschii]|uniref:DM13 domain-containing protein n=1 Tax=Prosthecodimorpha hirschii TaxID=665126 RepID=A0A0P6W5J5_9HYPH|nr:DM13 domain-containing protein [Prosthecomicrobium hirschii]KPL54464.1 hypothetical protein ABB55_21440 [Prosthecomicrobium hirschii]MCW1840690.1 DM13 domain-containing protein [Prosthecomicrobium hirschii]TPQ49511.1 hypothetical protein C2U72_18120 [Prosthecomicrobium hirschii]
MRASTIAVVSLVCCLSVAFGAPIVFGRGQTPAGAAETVPAAVPGPMRAPATEAAADPATIAAPGPASTGTPSRDADGQPTKGNRGKAAAKVAAIPVTSLQGRFHDGDPGRKGSGAVDLAKTERGFQLKLTGFATSAGPALEILLVPHPDPKKSADVNKTKSVSLGTLRSVKGDQIYTLPEGIDPAQFKAVVIWSKQLSVLFASAPLKPRS